ncbi:hypothetical protein B6S09_11220 [Oceanimonas baumannii]|uniref:Uncharacterized protein n=1 Tax=Oceanimonas baumannii TaxID=129578 RepID=A0A235CHB5_9GAMM|nr:hypothetical protein B6S09_11220 [Oceanimonas baumannii]
MGELADEGITTMCSVYERYAGAVVIDTITLLGLHKQHNRCLRVNKSMAYKGFMITFMMGARGY